MTYSPARDGFEVISGVISSNAISYLIRKTECSSICRSRATIVSARFMLPFIFGPLSTSAKKMRHF